MPYKVHFSEINVLEYLQRAAMLKILIITMLEIVLSLLPKVPIESHFWVGCKKLPTRLNIPMKKRTRMFMFGVMEWDHNLDIAIYSNY